jgi:riboflavin synthase
MFTGLIKDIGKIIEIQENGSGKTFLIQTPKLISEIKIDDSVAVNGVCLTATAVQADAFLVQAVHITLEKTNLGNLSIGSSVNLELALRAMDRLGGHLVQGHVGAIALISNIVQKADNYEISFTTPTPEIFKYIILEGSITIDGISLTVAKLQIPEFTVSIIPHTWTNTILHQKKIGDSVNIEVDMMAKYLENFVKFSHLGHK